MREYYYSRTEAAAPHEHSENEFNEKITLKEEELLHLQRSETRIGKELAERSIRKAVAILIVLMYFIPLLEVQNYFPSVRQS